MCQRKIIRKDREYCVPLLNGCLCPMIKEFRHVHDEPVASAKKTRKVYGPPTHCFDMHTQIPAGLEEHHVVFRTCICRNANGECSKLPPLLYPEPQMIDMGGLFEPGADEQDDDEGFDMGGTGVGAR